MIQRARIEGLDISESPEAIGRQLMTCYHIKLPVSEGDIARVLGILHVRKLPPLLGEQSLTAEQIRERMVPPHLHPHQHAAPAATADVPGQPAAGRPGRR